MKNKYIIAPGIAVMCSAVISSGYASSDKKEDTLVVTASGFTQQLRNAPASVSVITSEQLQKKTGFRSGRCSKKMLKGLVSLVGMKNRISVYVV